MKQKNKYIFFYHISLFPKVYKSMEDAMKKHPEADVMVSFASLRSAYESTLEAMEYPQIKTIAIIAEGIPENMTRKIIKVADRKNVTIIGEEEKIKNYVAFFSLFVGIGWGKGKQIFI